MTLSPFVWCSGNIVVDWLTSGLAGVLLDNFMWSLWLFDYFLSLLSDKRPCYTPLVEDSCEPKRRVRTIHGKGVLPLGLGRKIMMEQLQFDLNLVKKESQYFEDYGQNACNILDNIIPEPEFDHFGQGASNVPNAEELDSGVDWLNSFFDEPSHETCNINGLNPPISKLSDMPLTISAAYPSMVKMLGHSSQPDASLESLSLVSDEYPTSSVVLKSPSKTTSPDPFLGTSSGDSNHKTTKANSQSNIPQVLKKGQNFKVLTQLDKNTLNLATARELIQRLKTESQLQNAHRVPEQKVDSQRELMRNMKRSYGQIVKNESDTTENDSGPHSLLSGISRTVPELSSLQNGHPLCYDSPSQRSPGCAPASPNCIVGEKERSLSSADNTPTNDQPQERQPFYLSEEEKRTLITEGLPVPLGFPLSKMEERALKKVRRKIKNKISAQESRRKKKEYMEALEKKIEIMNGDNNDLKKKVDTLENTNRSLVAQLQKLQSIIGTRASLDLTTRSCQTTPCLMD